MKVSLNWLKQYVDIALPAVEVAERLTMSGTEVKGLQVIGEHWVGIVAGRITAVDPHPNADRLTLVKIDHGSGEDTVVCGAPNVAVGAVVAYATVGAQLLDSTTRKLTRLKSAKIRGAVSTGMACSERELGISDEHEGILILPEDTVIGAPLADLLGDVIFNLDITPNRPDCLSIIGIAREIAALTGEKVHLPDSGYGESGEAIESRVSVEIIDVDLCPRYCATLISGVTVAESPRWLRERLVSYGMRPINNIVDITNFVMLEYGQPLHAFDFERISGGRIIVRRARDGERIVSLDDVARELTGNMLVIADKDRAVAVAGVMGGANSEVTDGTTTILLEAASFNSRSVHYTARTLQMPSEASTRFERGIAPGLTLPAIKRATQLIAELGGGEAAAGTLDVYPGRVEPAPVTVSPEAAARVLGVTYSCEQIVDTLTALGFECRPGAAAEITVLAPDWRSDITRPVDLIEEVARVIGYDEIPVTMLSGSVPRHDPAPVVVLRRRLGEWMTGLGFQEIVSHSLTGLEMIARLHLESEVDPASLVRLDNPMTVTYEYLRPDLRSCLLSSLADNGGRASGGVRLYEMGKVYRPGEDGCLPHEFDMLAGVVSGARDEAWWRGTADAPDGKLGFPDLKGTVEGLLDRLGIGAIFEPGRDPSLHPASQAVILAGSDRLGVIGDVHPDVLNRFEIDGPACFFEISLPALLSVATGHDAYRPIPRFPAIFRDLALVVDAAVAQQQVADIIGGFPLVEQVTLFDVYSGEQDPAGKKSLAYRVGYQSPDHTLTDGEADKVQKKILSRLSGETGAVLRT